MRKLTIPEEAMKYFRLTGSLGGKARSARNSKEKLSAWGKLGGRPKKDQSTGHKKAEA